MTRFLTSAVLTVLLTISSLPFATSTHAMVPTIDSDQPMTRALFMQAIMGHLYPEAVDTKCLTTLDSTPDTPVTYDLLFRDVPRTASYALHLCAAMQMGIVDGYTDGTYQPNKTINVAEASAMLTRALQMKVMHTDGDPWYAAHMITLVERDALAKTARPYDKVTWGQTIEMMLSLSAQ